MQLVTVSTMKWTKDFRISDVTVECSITRIINHCCKRKAFSLDIFSPCISTTLFKSNIILIIDIFTKHFTIKKNERK